jgi:hypothetical protein
MFKTFRCKEKEIQVFGLRPGKSLDERKNLTTAKNYEQNNAPYSLYRTTEYIFLLEMKQG